MQNGFQKRNGGIQTVITLVGILCFSLAAFQHNKLLLMRTRQSSRAFAEVVDGPPLVTFTTTVLGGFRGILADILWVRAMDLQDTGKYLELVKLADWITMLEPRHMEVWSFHAWNMAYNVSILMPGKEDRWRWIQNAIHLLRERGIQYNPYDPALYVELGWIFQHKIGGESDVYHMYYKRKFAEKMHKILGGGFLKDNPLETSSIIRQLRGEYGLDPLIMKQVDTTFGPFDWRLPEVHAIYWAYLGAKRAVPGRDIFRNDRMVFQNLASLLHGGSLAYDPETGEYNKNPDFCIFEIARQFGESMLDKYDAVMVRDGYAYFLENAAELYRQAGDEKKSAMILELVQEVRQ